MEDFLKIELFDLVAFNADLMFASIRIIELMYQHLFV